MPGKINEVHKILKFEKLCSNGCHFIFSCVSLQYTVHTVHKQSISEMTRDSHVDIHCAFSNCMHTISLGGNVMH